MFVDVENPNGECPQYDDEAKGICYETALRPNKFQTHGALIGGPKSPDDAGDPMRVPYSSEGWNDWRTDWIGSEQTLDYNAAFTMSLAAAVELAPDFWTAPCGGAPNLVFDSEHACEWSASLNLCTVADAACLQALRIHAACEHAVRILVVEPPMTACNVADLNVTSIALKLLYVQATTQI